MCIRPSGEEKLYRVDIGVFRSCGKSEDELLVAECKKNEHNDR